MNCSPHILIAGASGYIGKTLIPELLKKFPTAMITALSRDAKISNDPRVSWVSCDLFSFNSLEAALPEKIDLVYYLVHSMSPTAQLDQGSFVDYDLLLCDNFSRALSTKNIQQLIYLGGLIPESAELSPHLRSRLEVEETFKIFKLPVTIFRAGLILGADGSSFQILLKLVKRLPVMVCPQWTQTLTTPVDLQTVLRALLQSALSENALNTTYDLASCRPLTYIQMMGLTARHLGLRRRFWPVPFFTPTLSRLWVSMITRTPKSLVYPLVESLEHPMMARATHLFFPDAFSRNYEEVLEGVNFKTVPSRQIFRWRQPSQTVRSVHRFPLRIDQTLEQVKNSYFSWLPHFLKPWFKVTTERDRVHFDLLSNKAPLLTLKPLPVIGSERIVFSITGGWLVSPKSVGSFEFRSVLGHRYFLIVITDFRPSLPSFVYQLTQAAVHLAVMIFFRKHLEVLRPAFSKRN